MAKREYVEANKRWLEEKAKEEGVLALPRGIYYKVLKQGDPKGRALKKVPNFKLHSLFLNFNSCPRSISSFKSGILFGTGI